MDDIKELRNDLTSLANHISNMEGRIRQLEESLKTKRRNEFNHTISLTIQKQDFIDSNPRERTDPFNDFELVFWASYILKDTNRREKIDTYAEVGKRAKRIKEVVKFFGQMCKTSDEKEKDKFGRQITKEFLEFVLLGIPTYKKDGQLVPMTFWPAVSDWSINNNFSKMGEWQRNRQLDKQDFAPVDED